MASKRVVIKKYENRRLYDTVNSRYVNLEEIAQLIRQGVDVQVVDAASGEDLTRIVLTQIIVEDAREPGSGFPLDLLRQMIIASGKASKDNVVNYMQTMAEMYQNAYRTFAPNFPPFNLFPAGPAGVGPAQSAPEPSAAAPANGLSVDDLNRRIQELERLVSAGAHGSPRTRAADKRSNSKRSTRE